MFDWFAITSYETSSVGPRVPGRSLVETCDNLLFVQQVLEEQIAADRKQTVQTDRAAIAPPAETQQRVAPATHNVAAAASGWGS